MENLEQTLMWQLDWIGHILCFDEHYVQKTWRRSPMGFDLERIIRAHLCEWL